MNINFTGGVDGTILELLLCRCRVLEVVIASNSQTLESGSVPGGNVHGGKYPVIDSLSSMDLSLRR